MAIKVTIEVNNSGDLEMLKHMNYRFSEDMGLSQGEYLDFYKFLLSVDKVYELEDNSIIEDYDDWEDDLE
jgi:enolase